MQMEEDPLLPPELGRRAKKRPEFILLVFKWLILILIPAAYLIPHFFMPLGRHPGQRTACRSNLKDLAAALQSYREDHDDRYPESLDQLVSGRYLQQLPTCPAAGKVSYTDYEVSRTPPNFSLSCVGDNHARTYGRSAPNCPRYNALSGFDEPVR
jgi:hypothetical protein